MVYFMPDCDVALSEDDYPRMLVNSLTDIDRFACRKHSEAGMFDRPILIVPCSEMMSAVEHWSRLPPIETSPWADNRSRILIDVLADANRRGRTKVCLAIILRPRAYFDFALPST
jgi:hypothetical protein